MLLTQVLNQDCHGCASTTTYAFSVGLRPNSIWLEMWL